jgi:putative acetyltransferase
LRITSETSGFEGAIRALLLAAFPTAVEADLVARLRHDGDIVIEMAAREGERVIGYVAFSRMSAPMKAVGLGPVAVLPARQRQGIGSALIREGLARAQVQGLEAAFVLGEPAYYRRFGFDAEAASGFASPYAGPYFMALALADGGLAVRSGRVDYAPAFSGLA